MSDIEYWGRIAQKPAKVDEGRHPFFSGKWNRDAVVKAGPVALEETRVRDEDLPLDEFT
jgi:hypothetical protein